MLKRRTGPVALATFVACLSLFVRPQGATGEEKKTPAVLSPAAQTLQDLKLANQLFASGNFSERRKEQVQAQAPRAIVLSCSDSRVPPEIIFGKGLGDLFTVRVAGNILGAATVSSIEYAAVHLGAGLLVVMGHESCGAVKAAITTERGETAGSYDLDSMVSSIQGNLDRAADRPGRATASPADPSRNNYRKPVMDNVDSVSDDLLKRSKIVRHLVETGKLKIVRAIYSLESGKVDFWGE